jgi:hypothetical protein
MDFRRCVWARARPVAGSEADITLCFRKKVKELAHLDAGVGDVGRGRRITPTVASRFAAIDADRKRKATALP